MVTLDLVAPQRKTGDFITQVTVGNSGWFSVLNTLRERFAGAWQRGFRAEHVDIIRHSTYWACVTLIASDISKLRPMLMKEDENDISTEIDSTSYSYVRTLQKPNHYQNRIRFLEAWVLSKLNYGNTYVLKARDDGGAVRRLYVLNPTLVTPMVSPDGSVFYDVKQDYLSGLPANLAGPIPASEIIHDLWNAMYHPLVGLSPMYAAALAAIQGLKIQENTAKLFANGSHPGGVLTAPASISNDTAARIQEHWEKNFSGAENVGRVAVLGDGLEYTPMAMSAVDAQLIDQLKWGDEKICAVLHVPGYKVGVGPQPLNQNVEALDQQYYAQGLQNLIESIELCLVEGLEISDSSLCVELDLDGLLRMDSATQMEFATNGVKGGILSPNEGRAIFNKKPVKGGDSPYLQQQNFSLSALDARDQANPAPSTMKPNPPAPALPPAKADLGVAFKAFAEKVDRAA